MTLTRWILCKVFKDHNWTSKGMQGEAPLPYKNAEELKASFDDHSRMYCEACKHVYKPNTMRSTNNSMRDFGWMAIFFGLVVGVALGGCALMAFIIMYAGGTFGKIQLYLAIGGISTAIVCWLLGTKITSHYE